MAKEPGPLPPELAMNTPPLTDDDLAAVVAWDLSAEEQRQLEDLPEHIVRWRPEDDGAAEWAMRHLVAVGLELDELNEQAGEWLEQIQRWLDHRAKPLRAKQRFFVGHLERYGLDYRERTKKATVTLPSGKVRTTEYQRTIKVEDHDTLAEWVRENLEEDEAAKVVQVKTTVLVSELKGAAAITDRVVSTFVALSCDCTATLDGMVDVGELVTCLDHGDELLGDPIVVADVLEEEMMAVVVDEAGRLIPGTGVKPKRTEAKVTANG